MCINPDFNEVQVQHANDRWYVQTIQRTDTKIETVQWWSFANKKAAVAYGHELFDDYDCELHIFNKGE